MIYNQEYFLILRESIHKKKKKTIIKNFSTSDFLYFIKKVRTFKMIKMIFGLSVFHDFCLFVFVSK